MKYLFIILLSIGCAAADQDIPEPKQEEKDCLCGVIKSVQVLHDPSTGWSEYIYQVMNECSGNYIEHQTFRDYDKGEKICFRFEW